MKCLKCSNHALEDKALCETCYTEHEKLSSYQKTDEWLNQTLDTTRDQFKIPGISIKDRRLQIFLERAALVAFVGAVLVYLILQSDSSKLYWKPPPQPTEAAIAAQAPFVVPTVDPDSRSLWVGLSPEAIPSLHDAIGIMNQQQRGPDTRWTIKLEAGDHHISSSVIVPSYTTIVGLGPLQSTIIGKSSGADFNDQSAALISLEHGSRIEQTSIENEGATDASVSLRCAASAGSAPQPSDTASATVRGVRIVGVNPGEQQYGILNDGCDLRIEQTEVLLGQASTTSQALLSVGDRSQTSINNSTLSADGEGGECTAQAAGGCIGISVVRGTVRISGSSVKGASQGAAVLDGTLELINSKVSGTRQGLSLIQTGSLLAENSTVSSIQNSSTGAVVCRATNRPDGTNYSADCS